MISVYIKNRIKHTSLGTNADFGPTYKMEGNAGPLVRFSQVESSPSKAGNNFRKGRFIMLRKKNVNLEEKLYQDVGKKIMSLATALAIAGFIALIAYGVIFIVNGASARTCDTLLDDVCVASHSTVNVLQIINGVILILCAPLFVAFTWLINGFGKLVVETHEIRDMLAKETGADETKEEPKE